MRTYYIHTYVHIYFTGVASDIYTPHTNDDIIVDIIIGFIGYVVTGLSLGMY